MRIETQAIGQSEIGDEREQGLVQRAVGDGDAFAALYDLYVTRVYRYAYRRLGNHADAEDLTAQTFHRALEALPRYEARGLPFGAWLFRIAHNLLIDRRRAGPSPLSLDVLLQDSDLNGHEPAPELAAELRDQTDTAWAAVAGLPALQQRAVALRFGQGLSHAEVGVRIGRSETATKQIIYRAIKTLRQRLGGEPATAARM
jgi:RNA polymerase sigma-70 factor, ECF subfamily